MAQSGKLVIRSNLRVTIEFEGTRTTSSSQCTVIEIPEYLGSSTIQIQLHPKKRYLALFPSKPKQCRLRDCVVRRRGNFAMTWEEYWPKILDQVWALFLPKFVKSDFIDYYGMDGMHRYVGNAMMDGARMNAGNAMMDGGRMNVRNGMLDGVSMNAGNAMLDGVSMNAGNAMMDGARMNAGNGMMDGARINAGNAMMDGARMNAGNAMMDGARMNAGNGLMDGARMNAGNAMMDGARMNAGNAMMDGARMNAGNAMMDGARMNAGNGMLDGVSMNWNAANGMGAGMYWNSGNGMMDGVGMRRNVNNGTDGVVMHQNVSNGTMAGGIVMQLNVSNGTMAGGMVMQQNVGYDLSMANVSNGMTRTDSRDANNGMAGMEGNPRDVNYTTARIEGTNVNTGITRVRDDVQLHVAAKLGDVEMVRVILMDCNEWGMVRNGNGMTPLDVAALRGHVDVVLEMLSWDALNSFGGSVDAFKKSSLHHAIDSGNALLVSCLAEHFSNRVYTTLPKSSRAAVQKCLVVDAPDQNDLSPLMLACQRGDDMSSAVAKLVEVGANTEFVNRNGDTALIIACRVAAEQCVVALLSARDPHSPPGIFGASLARPNHANYAGDRALDVVSGNKECPQIIRQLLNRFAVPGLRKNDGSTALHCAAKMGFAENCKELINWFEEKQSWMDASATMAKDFPGTALAQSMYFTTNRDLYNRRASDVARNNGHMDLAEWLSTIENNHEAQLRRVYSTRSAVGVEDEYQYDESEL